MRPLPLFGAIALAVVLGLLVASFAPLTIPGPASPSSTAEAAASERGSPGPALAPSLPGATGCPLSTLLGVASSLRHGGAFPRPLGVGSGALAAHSVDPAAVPNSGFAFNLTAYAMPSVGRGSFLLSEQEEIGTQVLIMGLFANSTFTATGSVPFWALLDNLTGHIVDCGFTTLGPYPGLPVSFQALHVGNRTWKVVYNHGTISGQGDPSYNITLNATGPFVTGSLSVVALSTWTTAPWVPREVNLTWTMRAWTAAGWYLPHPVMSSWNGTVPPGWGEAGTVQNASLPPGVLQIGSLVPVVPNGTALWTTSAPTPLTVTVSAPSSTVPGGTTAPVTVLAMAGAYPIAGQSVTLLSDGGGTVTPAPPWNTSARGMAAGNFTAPLVSAPTSVTLSAAVGSRDYQGFGNLTLLIVPTTLTLVARASSPDVASGGWVNVTVGAYHDGTGIGGVNLSLAASVGGGAFAPVGPWVTGRDGNVSGTYQAPDQPGPVEIRIATGTAGFSGSVVIFLNVTGGGSGPAPASSALLGQALDAALAVVLLLLLGVELLARRRPSTVPLRPPPPDGPLPHGGTDGGPAEGASGGATEHAVVPPSAQEGEASSGVAPALGPTCPACGAGLEASTGRFCPACGAPLSD